MSTLDHFHSNELCPTSQPTHLATLGGLSALIHCLLMSWVDHADRQQIGASVRGQMNRDGISVL
jgi:hypothetical protein